MLARAGISRMAMCFRDCKFYLQRSSVEMWCPWRLPVKDMVLKRNEGVEVGLYCGTARWAAQSRLQLFNVSAAYAVGFGSSL